jgi:hypothetical protein
MEKELDAIEGKIQILMDTGDFDENESDGDSGASDDAEKNAKEKKPRKTKAKKDEGPTLELFIPETEVNGTRNS